MQQLKDILSKANMGDRMERQLHDWLHYLVAAFRHCRRFNVQGQYLRI